MPLARPESLSPSKVSSFTNCPRAFQFRYIDRLPEPDTDAQIKGNVVHRALELLYERPYGNRSAYALRSMVQAWEELQPESDPENQLWVECNKLYGRLWELEDPNTVVVCSAEEKVEYELDGLMYRGIIDRVDAISEDECHLIDYKTGKVPNARQERERLHGLMFYAYLWNLLHEDTAVTKVSLYYLAGPTKITAAVDPQVINGVKQRLGAVWGAIGASCEAGEFRPRKGPLCSWCSFQSLCPAWAGTDPQGGS